MPDHDPIFKLLRSMAFATMWALSLALAIAMVVTYISVDHVGLDAHAYWAAANADDPYRHQPGYRDAYLYSPAFLHAITPVANLPWAAFLSVWMLAELACFVWLTQGLSWRWRGPILLLSTSEVLYGNIHAFLAVMLCVGLRRPGFWAFAILTKVTLGLVGIVWFLARRDWRALREIVLVTCVVVGLSALWDLGAWLAWGELLMTGSDGESHTSRLVRLVLVVLLVGYCATRDHAWVLPASLLLAAPRFSLHIKDLSILAATPRLLGRGTDESPDKFRDGAQT